MTAPTAEPEGKRGALVSMASDEFQLELPFESAWWACRQAVVDVGWEVESIVPDRLVTRTSWWGFARDPATIEVRLSDAGSGSTMIVVSGRIRWWGKRQLEGEMKRLRNAIEVAAHRSSGVKVTGPSEG
jgi:hypothetical protein